MKVIFLDIDGVLNSGDDMRSRYNIGCLNGQPRIITHDDLNCQLFDERCCRWLEYIIRSTGAKIVISSSWRLNGLDLMRKLWEKRGLFGDIIGVTPNFGNSRGEQIKAWLDANTHVVDYVIIDDDNDMLPDQQSRFVKCQFETGIMLESALKAIEILNAEKPTESE
jgi:hypothetical protein